MVDCVRGRCRADFSQSFYRVRAVWGVPVLILQHYVILVIGVTVSRVGLLVYQTEPPLGAWAKKDSWIVLLVGLLGKDPVVLSHCG